MNCGNCGCANEYSAKVCVRCKATLALTDHYRSQGFVEEEKRTPKPRVEIEDWEPLATAPRRESRETNRGSNTPDTGKGRRAPTENTTSGKGRRTSSSKGTTSRGIETPSRSGNISANGDRGSGSSATATRRNTGEKTSHAKNRRTTVPRGEEKKSGTTGKTGTTAPKKAPKQPGEKTKKIPESVAYNHTTKTLTLAERAVLQKNKKNQKKKKKKRSWPWVVLVLLLIAVGAGIFMGTMEFANEEDSYKETAAAFAEALVMDNEEALSDLIHPKMYGSLYPLNYQNVERCETRIVEYNWEEADALAEELQEEYGMADPIGDLYRVRVGCTVYGEGTYACTMDVLVGRIGTSIYVLKAENLSN